MFLDLVSDCGLAEANYWAEKLGFNCAIAKRMIGDMKSNPKTSSEYTAFENLLKAVIQVPHSEIKAKLHAEKREKKEKRPKTSDDSRVSRDKD